MVEIDVSEVSMGDVNQKKFPFVLHSSTYSKKIFVFVGSIKKWHQYLLGQQFIIHASIDKKIQSSLQLLTQARSTYP